MLMKAVAVVSIFAGVAAFANSESRGHTSNRRFDPDHFDSPLREPFMQPKAATSRSVSIRYDGTFSRHAHPLSLSHTELLKCVNTVIAECSLEVMSGCRGGPGELVNRLLSPASNRLARGSADPSGENRPP